MTNKEREIYDTYVMDSMKGRDYLVSAEERGEARGKAEGKAEGKVEEKMEIAQNLLNAGLATDLIAKSTGLSAEEIEKLKSS